MPEVDWHRCRFLESIENIKTLVHMRVGRTPPTEIAREIKACLQQGRQFYEAASSSPLEIRPLLLFYGMVGFAKALVIARRVCSLSTLPQTHGVTDTSAQNCRIEGLTARIDGRGTFQEFNDVVADLTRFCYFGPSTQPQTVYLPSANSQKLTGFTLSLREILSRIPGLEALYRTTFEEEAGTASFVFEGDITERGRYSIRIDDRQLFHDRASLQGIVERWRGQFPFLKTWCLDSAQHAWGYSVIEFSNVSNDGLDEFAEEVLVKQGDRYCTRLSSERSSGHFEFSDRLPPVGGGYSGGAAYAISPIKDCSLSEYALQYLGLFLLSSLVRYRPQSWVHAISRTSTAHAPPDDRALSLIEKFLNLNSTDVPSMIVTVLNPHEDRYA